jgi:hypothetical protein
LNAKGFKNYSIPLSNVKNSKIKESWARNLERRKAYFKKEVK